MSTPVLASPEQWATAYRLLIQAETEAAWAVANWTLVLSETPGAKNVNADLALKAYKAARAATRAFLAEVRFP